MTKKNNPDLRLPRVKLVDATHTGGLRRSYQKQLYGLFNNFDNKLEPGLLRMLERNKTNMNVEYASISKGFLREFWDKLTQIADVTINADSKKVIDKHVTLAYHAGKTKAVNNPRLTRESIRIPSALSIYDQKAIEDLRTRNFNLVTKATEDMKSNLLRIMTDDIRQGKGIDSIARDISNEINDLGRTRSKLIARTEIAYAYNNAVSDTYQKAGIERWQWLAALGFNCCDECIDRHGEVFDWGDEQPPLHPNCLCTIYPVVDRGF